MTRRESGIILHISSLPSDYGIGDLGHGAYEFADFLSDTGQTLWQILPLNPVDTSHGCSPYSSSSAFAGNPLFISPDLLIADGLLSMEDAHDDTIFDRHNVDYPRVTSYKRRILKLAYENCKGTLETDCEFRIFCSENRHWIEDYALFISLKTHFNGAVWREWPTELRDRNGRALEEWKERLREKIEQEMFIQYLFFKQWNLLKSYCSERNIKIIGDLPIYVCHDSCDVWTNPFIFKLDDEKKPFVVSGVPPDYFSETGQLWGTPVYDWDVLKEHGYSWWIRRIEHNLNLFSIVRLDHFRGFISFWEVPASHDTAIYGRWVDVPVYDFFNTLSKHFALLPFIAEDLGVITADVKEVINTYNLPGMKLLIFAFGEDMPTNPYIIHNIQPNSVAYTGTHDNNTIRGWYENEAGSAEKERLSRYLGRPIDTGEVHWEFIRMAMMSVSRMAIIPMQDVLGLGQESRMNTPSVCGGNWGWRLLREQLTPEISRKFLDMSKTYGRA